MSRRAVPSLCVWLSSDGLVEDDVVCVTVCVGVLALCRLTHDISLNEYEDDDLSEVTEITDENGITLSQLDLDPKVSLHPQINLLYRFESVFIAGILG